MACAEKSPLTSEKTLLAREVYLARNEMNDHAAQENSS